MKPAYGSGTDTEEISPEEEWLESLEMFRLWKDRSLWDRSVPNSLNTIKLEFTLCH